jgi:DHA1 family arabinose polymer transporter-like MFS transporter
MKKSLIALAFGTLGLGIAEFTMMGILPYVATDLGISIPVAGHFISAYALGVCFGAPMLLLARKRPLKQILLVLMALMIVGNICASMAPNYWVLLLGRFVSGLPHGAYFGVASIVAGKLADKGKSSEAVSIMIAGMTVANLFGVPGSFGSGCLAFPLISLYFPSLYPAFSTSMRPLESKVYVAVTRVMPFSKRWS